ncbi:MAG: hypothetical protein ACJ759_19105 [Thermoanaerobaculia bacterium]
MRRMPLACLLLAAFLLPRLADSREVKGTVVEVLTQSNEVVKLELRQVAPSPRTSSLLFTKKLEATPEEIAWFEIALEPKIKQLTQLREIRIGDAPLKLKSTSGELLFYPVVLITGTATEARSASWNWVGESLSGVSRNPGERSRPVSIPLSDVKVVRFPKP